MAIPIKYTTMLRLSTRLVRLDNSIRSLCSSTPLYCKDEGNSDTNKAPKPQESNNSDAKLKLNRLIESMAKENFSKVSSSSSISLTPKISKPKRIKKPQSESKIEPEMLQAVDEVTELFPEDKEGTRKSLTDKLEAVRNETQMGKIEAVFQDQVNEAEAVQDLSSSDDRENVKTDHSEQITTQVEVEPAVKYQGPSADQINLLLSTLKVDANLAQNNRKRTNSRKSDLEMKKGGSLFDGTPLKIFENVQFESLESTPKMTTWKRLNERELELSVANPPTNGFQQMILWTRQGKLWQFPINNEQGLEEEARVGFHEHIFMEPHINSWCPKRGPIRHFMELVCVGLSKNPYLTVSQKKEHINWFQNYFAAKRSILIDTGAIVESTANRSTA